METPTYAQNRADAWGKLKLDARRKPEEVFPRFQKKDFDELKADYQEKYGYVIQIPEISQIVHWKPNLSKTPIEIKAEKKEAFNRILASPSPGWARQFTTVMTFLDDIQDATSVIYPAVAMLSRALPKVMGRLLPILGWMMLGGDILNLIVGIGRLPMGGMGGKRLNCHFLKHNPFTKQSIWRNAERLRLYKPGIADLIQVAQTTDNIIGVGISLGPIMGFMQDAVFGAYHYIKGDKVRIAIDTPDIFEHELVGSYSLKAAALINTQGQTFSEETHFRSLTMGALGARLYLPYAYDADISASVQDPMSIMIPAPYPKNPITLEVIKDHGLDPDRGYGWPMNGKPEIPLGDLFDYIVYEGRRAVKDYWRRHEKDWYGLVSAHFWDQVLPMSFKSFDPTAEAEYEDTAMSRIAFTMVKAPVIPKDNLDEQKKAEFLSWAGVWLQTTGSMPGVAAIKEKFKNMGVPYRESFPATREEGADELFDKDLDTNSYSLY